MGSPVFNDTTGTRVSAIKWGSRIFLVLVLLLAAALAYTLRSHVSVPGLERLGVGLDARNVRPLPRTNWSDPPAEQAKVATGSSTFRAQPSTRPTTVRAGGPPPDVAEPAETRRTVDPRTSPTSGPTAAEPSSAPTVAPTTVAPTGSAGSPAATPTVPARGPGAEKTRNPKAATPTPGHQQAPGQTRRPKPKPTTDVG